MGQKLRRDIRRELVNGIRTVPTEKRRMEGLPWERSLGVEVILIAG